MGNDLPDDAAAPVPPEAEKGAGDPPAHDPFKTPPGLPPRPGPAKPGEETGKIRVAKKPNESGTRRAVAHGETRAIAKPEPIPATGDPADVAKARENPKSTLGRYVIVEEIGRGGMGVVYRAWQVDLRRYVALKVLNPTDDKTIMERFHREAIMASQVRHPGIVGVHEYGESEGRHFIVMDLLTGDPLDGMIHQRRLGTRLAVEIIAEAAEALAAAHKRNIIHRDIKPSNIIVERRDGELKVFLTDFGLAKPADVRDKVTQAGTILGTPHYMSPEQARGDQRMDPRSDVYSLGAVLYELVAGRQVFLGSKVFELLRKIINEEPAPLRRLDPKHPQDLENVVLKCLEKSPDRRYPEAGALAADLRSFLDHRAVSAVAIGRGTRAVRWVKRRPWAMAATAGAAVVALGLALFVALRSRGAEMGELRERMAALQGELDKAQSPERRAQIERELARMRGEAPRDPGTPAKPLPGTESKGAYERLVAGVLAAPASYVSNLAAIDAFLSAHGSSPETVGARELRSKIEALRVEAAIRTIASAKAEADRLRRERKFAAALAALDRVSPELGKEGVEAEVRELRRTIEKDCESAWSTLLARVESFKKAGELERARQALDEALAFADPYPAQAAQMIADLGQTPGDAPPPDGGDASAAFADFIQSVSTALAAGDVPKAVSIASAARGSKTLAGRRVDVEAVAAAVEGQQQLHASAAAGFAKRVGEKTTLALATGQKQSVTILGVKGEDVRVRVAEFDAETSYAVKALARTEIAAAARLGGLSEGACALALLLAGEKPQAPPELATLFEALREDRAERGAIAALEALRKAKDPAKLREILDQIDREFARTEAVTAARTEIEQAKLALELKGVDISSLVHATLEKVTGGVTHLEYAFATEAELADTLVDWHIFAPAMESPGWDVRRDDGLVVHNARAQVGPAWRGNVTAEVRFTWEATPQARVVFSIGPVGVAVAANGSWQVEDARGRAVVERGRFDPPKPGETSIRLELAGDSLEIAAFGGGPVKVSVEPVEMGAVAFSAQNVRGKIRRLVVTGVPDPAWAKKAAEKRDPKLGAVAKLFGGTMQGWTQGPVNAWSVEGGVLRGQSNSDGQGTWLNSERKIRNGRVTFEYRYERGRAATANVRQFGDGNVTLDLPSAEQGRWRKVEIVAVEERAWAAVDGVPHAVEPRSGTCMAGAFSVNLGIGTTVHVRDVKVQPIEAPPLLKSWTELLNPSMDGWKAVAGEGRVEKGTLVMEGPCVLRTIAPFPDGEATVRVKLAEGGEAFVVVRFAQSNGTVGDEVRVPADGRWHEVSAYFRGNELRATLDGRAVPIQRRLANGPDGNLALDAKRGRLEVQAFKVRQ